jgi:glutamine---fructose-6-phosphate transaminase (isomerizing)
VSITAEEIASQPQVWSRALDFTAQTTDLLACPGERLAILGCGTSAFVADSLAQLREGAGYGLTDAAYASEWVPRRTYDRVVVLSRSGTTTEVLQALERVPAGTRTTAIVGAAGTPVTEAVDDVLLLSHADELSVVQTRFPTTVLVLARAAMGEDVAPLIAQGTEALAAPAPARAGDYDHFVFLGTGWTRGLADEAALKVREAAQFWSESYPLMDYRHGPIAVAHPGSLVYALGQIDDAVVADIERTGAHVVRSDVDPIVQLVGAQRLAVDLAAARGLDPDQPRHLTRSVVLA